MKTLLSFLLFLPLAALMAASTSSLERIERFRVNPSASAEETQDALDRSIDRLSERGGGLLLLPPSMDTGEERPTNSRQGVWRTPPPPAPAQSWGRDPGVTVFGLPGGTPMILPPQLSGLQISRTLDLPQGQSLPHWGYQPMLRMANAVVNGSDSAGILRMDTDSHNENQTFDFMLWRRHYSQGDAYLFDARMYYMGDGTAPSGPTNGAVYSAAIASEVEIFRGNVRNWDSASGVLSFQGGRNAHSLGSGRPLINLNPAKGVARGRVWIMAPGGSILGSAGDVRSRDAGWTSEVVGRYFAVDEPGEYVPGGTAVRRWWLITSLRTGTNGVQSLGIQRHWWGAKDNQGLGRLYRPENYTRDAASPRLLRYLIAPGALVYDASDGVAPPQAKASGTFGILRLAPGPDLSGSCGFAVGDPVEQAIGSDPFKPIAFRSWVWDSVPGVFPAPIFDIANQGAVMRHAVMTVRGGSGDVAHDRAERPDANPPWNSLLELGSAVDTGLVFAGDTARAAIRFDQPNAAEGRRHVIRWNAAPNRRMEVSEAGGMILSGGASLALANEPLTRSMGLSAGTDAARSLRGVGVRLVPGARQAAIVFERPEPDAAFAIVVSLSWPAEKAVPKQSPAGFTVEFSRPAPTGATLDWTLIR